jgi:hypothetical protein
MLGDESEFVCSSNSPNGSNPSRCSLGFNGIYLNRKSLWHSVDNLSITTSIESVNGIRWAIMY